MYLAIDPGISTGWAVVDSAGVLQVCGAGENFPVHSNRDAIIEKPMVYPKQQSKKRVDPNNLITLAIRVGPYQERLLAAGVLCDLVLPVTWKGTIDKDRHHPRIDATLSESERKLLTMFGDAYSDKRNHDVWDAVALCKWAWQNRRFASLRA